MDNVDTIRRMFRAVETGDLDVLRQHVAPEMLRHDLVGAYPEVTGAQVTDFITMIRAGAPDIELNIQDIFGCEDHVVVRFVLEGTHEGELFGRAATGSHIAVNAINIYRFEDGLVRETWQLQDLAGFLAQIGS